MSTSIGELEGTISLEDQFSNALSMVGRAAENIFGEMEGMLGTVTLAATAAGAALVGIAGTITYLGIKGSQLNDLDNGFEHLAGSAQNATNILEAMNRGVADTIDSTKLLQFANRALSTGAIKTAQDFGTVTAAARVLARQGLGEVESNMQAISSAMATGRVKQIQNLVGVIDLKKAYSDYAASIGTTAKQLNQAGQVHAAQIAIIDRLNGKIDQAGNLQKSFAEKVTSARLAVGNWFDDIAKAVAKSPAISNAFDAIGDSLVKNFGGGTKTLQDAIIQWVERFANAAAHYGPIVIDWLGKTYEWVTDVWHRVQQAWDTVPDWFKKIALEAGATALAVKLAKSAFDGFTPGAGGGSVLGDVASTATIVSGLQSVIQLGPKVAEYFGTIGKVASAAGAGIKLAWGTEGVLGALTAVRMLVQGMAIEGAAMVLSFLGPVGLAAAGLTVLGITLYNLRKGIHETGQSLVDLAQHKETSNYIKGLKDETGQLIIHLDEAKKKLDDLGGNKQLLFQGRGLEAHMPGQGGPSTPPPNEIKGPDVTKIMADTKSSIKATYALWDQYYTEIERGSTDTLTVAVANINRRFETEKHELDESIKTNKNYTNQLVAMEAVRAEQIANAQRDATMRSLREMTDAFAKAMQDAFDAPGLLSSQPIKALPAQLKDISTAAGRAGEFIVDAMNKAAQSVIPLSEENKNLALSMFAVGASAQEVADRLHVPVEQVQRFSKEANRLTNSLDVLAEGFEQLSQIGGTSIGAFIRGMGQMVSVTNTAVKAVKSLQEAQRLGSAGFSDYFSAGMSIANIAITGISLLSDWLSKAAKLQQELFEFKTNSSAVDTMNALTQATMGYSKALIDAVMNAKTLAEAQNAMKQVDEAARMATEASQKYGPSTGDLITQYEEALKLYQFMEKTGAYTAEQLKKAWEDVEKAKNRAGGLGNPKPGTDVATEADRIAQEMRDQAEAAGYQTQEALQAAADKAEKLYEYLRDSGKYTAEQIEDAYKKAQDAMNTAYGINTELMKKMKTEFDTLQKAVDAEAPEAVMGSIETAQRARMDELKKSMEAEQARIAEAQKAAAETNGKATGQAQADAFAAAFKNGGVVVFGDDFHLDVDKASTEVQTKLTGASTVVSQGFDVSSQRLADDFHARAREAADNVTGAFAGVEIRIPIHFDPDPMPQVLRDRGEQPEPMAAGTGGVAFASGPMTFSTKGNEYYAFGGEGKGLAGLFSGTSGQSQNEAPSSPVYTGPKVIQLVLPNNKILTTTVLKDLQTGEFHEEANKTIRSILR